MLLFHRAAYNVNSCYTYIIHIICITVCFQNGFNSGTELKKKTAAATPAQRSVCRARKEEKKHKNLSNERKHIVESDLFRCKHCKSFAQIKNQAATKTVRCARASNNVEFNRLFFHSLVGVNVSKLLQLFSLHPSRQRLQRQANENKGCFYYKTILSLSAFGNWFRYAFVCRAVSTVGAKNLMKRLKTFIDTDTARQKKRHQINCNKFYFHSIDWINSTVFRLRLSAMLWKVSAAANLRDDWKSYCLWSSERKEGEKSGVKSVHFATESSKIKLIDECIKACRSSVTLCKSIASAELTKWLTIVIWKRKQMIKRDAKKREFRHKNGCKVIDYTHSFLRFFFRMFFHCLYSIEASKSEFLGLSGLHNSQCLQRNLDYAPSYVLNVIP